VQERDELKELHRSAVIEAQKSFAREEVCLKEMARRDARANKPRTSPQLGWDELRQQLAAMTAERDELTVFQGMFNDMLLVEVELRKQLAACQQARDKYRKQVQLGFKHLIETPVLTDEAIEEGYTAFEHLRKALCKVIAERDAGIKEVGTWSREAGAAQAREQQLREALEEAHALNINWSCEAEPDALAYYSEYKLVLDIGSKALALPQDDTALRQWEAKLLRDYDAKKVLNRKADELEQTK
jgi:hypothetical protein